MKMRSTVLRLALIPAAALSLAACSDALAPAPAPVATEPGLSLASAPSILECPIDTTRSVSATIGLLGGTLELDGHRLVIPLNAVLLPTEFTLTVPASNYMEVRVTAAGQEHFEFLQPVSLTLSYGRCSRSNIEKENLRIFHIDGNNAILEDMGGTDDKAARTVTTSSDHLSDYAIGMP